MPYASQYGNGYSGTVPSETYTYLAERGYIGDATRRVAVYCHGRNATSTQALDVTFGDDCTAVAEAGWPVLGIDAGGLTAWGNDASIARVGDAVTYAISKANAKTGKVVLMGTSMGGLTVLNYARANLSKVAGILLSIPVVDLPYVHDTSQTGWATEIDTAYTNNAGYLAGLSTHNPVAYGATLAGIPVFIWYSTNDTVTSTARIQAFQTAVGASCQIFSLGAVGHTAANLPSAAFVDAYNSIS